MSAKFFDSIITDSNEMNKVYFEKFKKIMVIKYGPTMTKSNEKLIKKFGLSSGNYYLIVGRLIPDNNSKLIIKGFLASRSNKKIVVVGDVPYHDNYADSVKNYKSKK